MGGNEMDKSSKESKEAKTPLQEQPSVTTTGTPDCQIGLHFSYILPFLRLASWHQSPNCTTICVEFSVANVYKVIEARKGSMLLALAMCLSFDSSDSLMITCKIRYVRPNRANHDEIHQLKGDLNQKKIKKQSLKMKN